LHVRGGEFVADEVEDLMDQDTLVEAACREIVQYTGDRQPVQWATLQNGTNAYRLDGERHRVADNQAGWMGRG
jgi:DNA repair protein RadD